MLYSPWHRYPAFRSQSLNVSKHVAVLSELARLVDVYHLLDVSQFEQELACADDHASHYRELMEKLTSSRYIHPIWQTFLNIYIGMTPTFNLGIGATEGCQLNCYFPEEYVVIVTWPSLLFALRRSSVICRQALPGLRVLESYISIFGYHSWHCSTTLYQVPFCGE